VRGAPWLGLGVCAIAALLLAGVGQPLWPAAIAGLGGGAIALLIGQARRRTAAAPQADAEAEAAEEPADLSLAEAFDWPVVLINRDDIVLQTSRQARGVFPALAPGRTLAVGVRDPELVALPELARRGGEAEAMFTERGAIERLWRVRARVVGKAGETALLFEDLTEQRALERMRVDFIANASHELRTPLASILGFIETLQGPARQDAAARDRFLPVMRDQAARMARLIDDLLSLSRAELRAHQAPTAVVDLATVTREIAGTLQLRATEHEVVIDLSGVQGAMPVTGDRDDLLRLTENLIENAIRYGRSGGRVLVGLEGTAEAGVRLSVRDFGPGIAPRDIPRVTERFYRADASHSREVGGTGLGLAIVKHIALRHQARLEIGNADGGGALVTVTFPAVDRHLPL
jgi:two-component system, OmpR family, phosphate regulon sensor histidine kinase PhoR